jgi:small-conductance mechanosensitive channel
VSIAEVLWICARVAEGCLLLALIVAIIAFRHIGKSEVARVRSGLGAVERRLGEADAELKRQTEELQQKAREAELGLARINPQLDSLSKRVDELHAAIARCATSDQLVQVLGRLEAMAMASGTSTGRVAVDLKPS